jgi:hypothetical protein
MRIQVFINEALTQRRSMLKSTKIKGCWTVDGKIFVRGHDDRCVNIRTIDDLTNMLHRERTTRERPDESDTDTETLEESADNETVTENREPSTYSDAVKKQAEATADTDTGD